MSKHTPGPWFVTGNMTLYVDARIGGGLLQEVAAVGPTEADSGYGPQQRANADLIAAAPDLLEALGYCQSWFAKHAPTAPLIGGFGEAEHPMLTCINAAIAKARGEA